MKMAYFVWALTNGSQTVVVDLGFTEPVGTRRGRQFLRCPSEGLAMLGIDCASVEHVILSHFHYDHVGCYALFPHATFYVQDAEMSFYTGRHLHQAAFRHSVELDDILALVRFNYEGRVVFVDGDKEIVPGISVHKVGGHTAGMQIVTVQTQGGRAVVASDASHYYHNFEKNVPFTTHHDLPGMYYGFQRLRELADRPDRSCRATIPWCSSVSNRWLRASSHLDREEHALHARTLACPTRAHGRHRCRVELRSGTI
jgi:glyoxylase-like metal-dependent hydrolase (beta-lactamase superfamily II)